MPTASISDVQNSDESVTLPGGRGSSELRVMAKVASVDNGDVDFGPHVYLSTHPVVCHKLTILRSSNTPPTIFRAVLREITYHLGYEATSRLSTRPVAISVPVPDNQKKTDHSSEHQQQHIECTGSQIRDTLSLIPILRSGLGMVESMLELLPMAAVHHIGMYKVAGQHPVQYYNRLPKICNTDVAYVLDPVIATSSTILSVIRILKKWGVKQINVITVVASRAGLKHIAESFPTDVYVYAAVVDDELTDDGLILPGLGDAGDRQFGTHVMSYENSVSENGIDHDESLVHPSKRKRLATPSGSSVESSRATTPNEAQQPRGE